MAAEPGDSLLRAYVGELTYLRHAGEDFARKHPKLARRLELGREGSADPQVQRLIESFAFLTGRLQREIEADFPLIPAALLGVLYPHLTAPVPSLAIARFDTDAAHSRAIMGAQVPRHTALYATAADGVTCRFRTSQKVTLWPIQVTAVELLPPTVLPEDRTDVGAVLRVRLTCQGKRTFAEMAPASLRFFIDADPATAEALYEGLVGGLREVVAVAPESDLPLSGSRAIRVAPVGFEAEQGLLPHGETAHQGYRLLQEFFVFPEKFLFVDVNGLPSLAAAGREVDLLFLLARRPPAGTVLGPDSLQLGCTPMVNLFPKTSEPIRLDHTQVEYRLNPDVRWERSTEIHSVLKVSATAATEGEDGVIRPFFSVAHLGRPGARECYWMARRQRSGRPDLPGSDILLSFKDLGLNPAQPAAAVVFAHTLCTNRGIADQIPAGTKLEMELAAPVSSIRCVTRPTPQLEAPEDGETLWQLVSHLSLNHLSLNGGGESLAALKEILRLYAALRSAAGHQVVDALESLNSRRVVRRIGDDAWRGFCRGLRLELAVDDRQPGIGLYLFTAVLSRFLGLYAGINSFTELAVRSRRYDGPWITWPAIAGEALVL